MVSDDMSAASLANFIIITNGNAAAEAAEQQQHMQQQHMQQHMLHQ